MTRPRRSALPQPVAVAPPLTEPIEVWVEPLAIEDEIGLVSDDPAYAGLVFIVRLLGVDGPILGLEDVDTGDVFEYSRAIGARRLPHPEGWAHWRFSAEDYTRLSRSFPWKP